MMKNLLHTELRKAFRNGYFLAALALGIQLACIIPILVFSNKLEPWKKWVM